MMTYKKEVEVMFREIGIMNIIRVHITHTIYLFTFTCFISDNN